MSTETLRTAGSPSGSPSCSLPSSSGISEYERLCAIGGALDRCWRAGKEPNENLVKQASDAVYDLARIELEKIQPPPSYEDHEDYQRIQWLHMQTRTWGGVALAINGVTVGTGENVRAAIDSAISKS